jgi:hypothetical protein
MDLRDRADGSLWLIWDQYQAETAWAPKNLSRELGHVRASAEDVRLRAIRSEAEAEVARKADDCELAARHEQQAEPSRCPQSAYRVQKNILAGLMDDRRAWEAATEPQRRLANAKPKLANPNYECHDDREGGSGDATNVDDRPVVVPGCRPALARRRAERGDRRGRFAIASSVTQAVRPVGPDGEPCHWDVTSRSCSTQDHAALPHWAKSALSI